MKKVFFATISLTIIACLSFIVFSYFNHANPILSETDVINDFLTSHPLISNNTVSVENVHITKRRTKAEDGTDSVYLCLTASNDKYTYTGNYVILNQLYNDGWKRETITTESELYKPKRGVSNEELDSHLSQFSMFVLSEPANHVTELDRGIERISYNAEFLAQTFSISAYITLIYEWDFHSGAWELYQLDYNPQLLFHKPDTPNHNYLNYISGTIPNSITWQNAYQVDLNYNKVFPTWYFADKCHVTVYGGTSPEYRVYVYDTYKVGYTISIDEILSNGYITLNVYPGFGQEMLYIY